ncbi:hypothetical protein HOD38_04680 [archaeon]|jgi:hypothetical protein|nr:hypothetical protein [archaeon]MBT4397538.1 hypothetical protein [archaeon]MBT4440795.1 hypothetical protein [archaeon]
MPKTRHRKKFFEQRTVAEIKRDKELVPVERGILTALDSLDIESQVLVIERDMIIGSKTKDTKRKYGASLQLNSPSEPGPVAPEFNLMNLLRGETDHAQLREMLQGYTYEPHEGPSNLVRRVYFWDIFEAMRLAVYSKMGIQWVEPIELTVKDRGKSVANYGAEAVVRVPSRREKLARYEFKAIGIPVYDNEHARTIARNFATTHNSGDNLHRDTRQADTGEDPRQHKHTVQSIAAYFALIEHYAAQGNQIPFDVKPFPFLSEDIVRTAQLLDNHTLYREEGELKRVGFEVKEMILTAQIILAGPYSPFRTGKNIQDYSWGS